MPGGILLLIGFLSIYYQVSGKWYNYIFGLLYTIIYSFLCFRAGYYAYIFFAVICYIPSQVYGLFAWFKKTEGSTVKTRSLSFKNAILLMLGIAVMSAGIGALLSLIPSQNMAYVDTVAQLFNVSASILCSLRMRECWYAWFIQNALVVIMWSIGLSNGAGSAISILIINAIYFIGNILGMYLWYKNEKNMSLNKGEDIPQVK